MTSKTTSRPDLLLVTPPLSPSDTNAPLGPAVIRRAMTLAGQACVPLDLNVKFLHAFGRSGNRARSKRVGDQDKDRALTHSARDTFLSLLPLNEFTPSCVPDCVDARLGLCYPFEDIWNAVKIAARPGHRLGDFARWELVETGAPPTVLGVSIMGPPQLFFALLVTYLSKQLWPDVPVIAGGSHVTLLRSEIAKDLRYGWCIDAFLPHHSERQVVDLIRAHRTGASWQSCAGVLIAGSERDVCPAPGAFDYLPEFLNGELAIYGGAQTTIPLQFSRGCLLDCGMCTYRASEPILNQGDHQHRVEVERAVGVFAAHLERGYSRFSVKDSLLPLPALRGIAAHGREIRARGLALQWSATTLLVPKLADFAAELAAGGLATVEFGIESIHPRTQGLIDKAISPDAVEHVTRAFADAGIAVVLNLIYGFPGESIEDARAQLAWFESLRAHAPEKISASHNLLEINRGAPFAAQRGREAGIELGGISPWAFSYVWNAPHWRVQFHEELRHAAEEVAHV